MAQADDDIIIPPMLIRALEEIDPDTQRWCMDFLNELRSRCTETIDQVEKLESDCEQYGRAIERLRNLLARVHNELSEQMSLDLRNTIAKELALPIKLRTSKSAK